MKRVLFVDDEPQVLDGLRNLLWRHRRRWEMEFALGGPAALQELERAPCDVIVTDMLMPGMDGAELLHEVKDRWPSTVRIVLSGHADAERVARVLPVSHQYLSKPCDGETLRAVIERATAAQQFIVDDRAREAVGQLAQLPSAAGVYWELTRRIADPRAGTRDIADIVCRDQAMSAKLLQIVNSAYFGLARPVASVHQAVAYLGIELVRGLALSANIFSCFEQRPVTAGVDIEVLQAHALTTAILARHLIDREPRQDEALVAGLLHDVGKLVLAVHLPERFSMASDMVQVGAGSIDDVETKLMGVSHAAVGAYLLGLWGLPAAIVQAVACHHSPLSGAPEHQDLAVAVHVADLLAHRLDSGTSDRESSIEPSEYSVMGVSESAVQRALAALAASTPSRTSD